MNKKLLALLLIAPVALFAADKALGHDSPGGGKEKNRKKTAQETPATQAEAEPATEMQTTQAYSAPVVTEASNAETSAAERRQSLLKEIATLKADFDREGAAAEQYNEINQIWLGDERLDADTREFLEEKVATPFEAANLFGINLEESFSRCPSGYHIVVVEGEDQQPTNEGYLVRDQGCWDRPVARFRYNVPAQAVAVILSAQTSIDLDEFLKLYKKAS